MRSTVPVQLLLAFLACAASRPARAELSLRWGGKLQSDIRLRVQEKGFSRFYQPLELPVGVSRNENIFKLKLNAEVGPVTGVAELDFAYYGLIHEVEGVEDLALRERVDPYRIEAHAAYIDYYDFLVEGLDLRVGQQIVAWGKGDQFNPTNTLNANDVEDPLLFGEQVANLMVKLDYTVKSTWTFSGVLVPMFKPALLPEWAALGTAATDRLPMVDEELRWRLHAEKGFTERMLGYPTIVTKTQVDLPDRSLDNMQGALRVAGTLGEHDVALSYYVGRTDLPQPYVNMTRLNNTGQCNPMNPNECIKGLLETEVHLGYPRMQVIGFNMAGQVNPLGWLSPRIQPLGYRFELGVYLPQQASLILLQDQLAFGGMLNQPAGEYNYKLQPGGQIPRPVVVDETPFTKWVLGLDYTFGKYVYFNVQWVHGFPDEFGAGDFIHEGWSVRRGGTTDNLGPLQPCFFSAEPQRCLAEAGEKVAREILRPRLGDYLVLGVDIKLMSERMLLRLFSIWDLIGVYEEQWDEAAQRRVREHHSMFSSEGFSAVLYPELQYNFGYGLDLGAGALVMLGKDYTKFGDPTNGGTQVFTRARFQF